MLSRLTLICDIFAEACLQRHATVGATLHIRLQSHCDRLLEYHRRPGKHGTQDICSLLQQVFNFGMSMRDPYSIFELDSWP